MGKNTELERVSAAKQVKNVRQIRFTDSQWSTLCAGASADGIGVSEYLRRIIDIHNARKDLEERFIASLARLEGRMDGVEKAIGKAAVV